MYISVSEESKSNGLSPECKDSAIEREWKSHCIRRTLTYIKLSRGEQNGGRSCD